MNKYGMTFKEFDNLVGHDSYVLCNGKKRVSSGDTVPYETALDWLKHGGTVGWLVRPGYIVLDVDEGPQQTLHVLKELGINTLMCKTSKGIHLYLSISEEFQQVTKWITSWGCLADTRTAGKGYVILPFNMDGRRFNKCRNIHDFNIWLTPLQKKKEEQTLLNLGEGSRNDSLFRHLIKLKQAGFSPKKYTTLGKLINRYIFAVPFDDEKEVLRTAASVYKRDVKIRKGENPFQIYNSKGDAVAINERAIIEHFLEHHHVIVLKGIAYAYANGLYVEAGLALKKTIQDLITEDRLVTHSRISDTYRLLVDQPDLQKTAEDLEKFSHIICFKNGVFDTQQKKFLLHSPKYLSLAQLPWNLDLSRKKNIKDTIFYKFFHDFCGVRNEEMKMMLEFMAYTITSRYDLKCFLCLLGPGDTGKSMFIRWMEKLIGKCNTSHLSIQEVGQKFYPAQLIGKLLNTCADNPSLPLKSINIIKQITGGDRLMAEFKGKDSFPFMCTAKLIFSFNQMPLQLEERSDAYYNRMRILPLTRVIRPPQDMFEEFYSDEAFEELLPFLVKLACTITSVRNTDLSQFHIKKLHEDSDPLFGFFNSKRVEKTEQRGRNHNARRTDLYVAFTDYCLETSRKACGKHQFFRHMETLGYRFYVSRGEYFVEGVKLSR